MALRIVDGPAAGGWIGPELTGDPGSVTGLVPDRYDAYVRILHPASMHGASVTWGQVAAQLGRTVHPLAQWDAIVGANRYLGETPDWPGNAPLTGSLRDEQLRPLLETLDEFTTTPMAAFFGIWGGKTWGKVSPGSITMHSARDLASVLPSEVARPALLALPGREYAVLAGRPEALTSIEAWLPVSPTSPNLIWPEDRAWFLATEIDFDSTVVGGSEEAVRAVLDAPPLESFPIAADGPLTADADEINPPLRWEED